jgi:hypothetical protein
MGKIVKKEEETEKTKMMLEKNLIQALTNNT